LRESGVCLLAEERKSERKREKGGKAELERCQEEKKTNPRGVFSPSLPQLLPPNEREPRAGEEEKKRSRKNF